MKIKNIVQIAILAGLVTTGSIKPMAAAGAALRAATRWSLQKGGTIIGLGLPTYPFLKKAAQFACDPDPNDLPGLVARPVSQEEALILQKHIKSDVNIKIAKNNDVNEFGGLAFGNTIVLPKELTTVDGQVQVEQILQGNDTNARRAVIGILQHEEKHLISNHIPKKMAETAIIPPLITATTALLLKRFLPFGCIGRFFTKVTGGLVLTDINSIVLAAIQRQHEFEADQNISQENREAFASTLKMLNEKNKKIMKQNLYVALLRQGLDHDTIQVVQNIIAVVAPFFSTHPHYKERIKRLQQNSTKIA